MPPVEDAEPSIVSDAPRYDREVGRTRPIAKAIGAAALAAVIVCGVLALRWCHQHSRGVEIRLHNVERSTLRSLKVSVTGNSYPVGDLDPGATTSVWVKPTSESGVDVSFVTSAGQVTQVPVHGYIEPGYSGWISADLTTVGARNVEDHVELY
jgi:hypothetical protein